MSKQETVASPAQPELTYEQARGELAAVVEKLEAGGSTLEDSLALWERGEHLAEVCQRWLDGARARLDAAREERAAQPR
jgi:exodeoxyribonuclease VII small subunit